MAAPGSGLAAAGATAEPAAGPSPRAVWAMRALNTAAFLAVIVANKVGGPGPYGPGSSSAKHPTPITPAGYTFAIWGLIYLAQALLWFVYQWTPLAGQALLVGRIAYWHLAVCACNVAWIVCTSYDWQPAMCAILLAQAGLQAVIYYRMHCLGGGLCTRAAREGRTWADFAFVYVPWSLYSSWVFGASLIGAIAASGVAPEDAVYAGLVAMAFAAAANVGILAWSRDVAFAAVNVWTFVGIYNRKAEEMPLIGGAAYSLAFVVGGFALAAWAVNLAALVGPSKPTPRRQADESEPLLPTGM